MEFIFFYWILSIIIIWFSIDNEMDKQRGTDWILLLAPLYLLVLIGKALRKYHDI
jgi:hypothetical protein